MEGAGGGGGGGGAGGRGRQNLAIMHTLLCSAYC